MGKEPRLTIVGELNPYGADPYFALYHLPRNASGNRLREHLGLRDATYEKIQKTNLCEGEWSIHKAVTVARQVIRDADVVLMLGASVRRAFGKALGIDPPYFFEAVEMGVRKLTVASLPHPSGLSRPWNEPGARGRARDLVRRVAPWLPVGEADESADEPADEHDGLPTDWDRISR